jgi:molybdenum cofactor guanylyltransferase
MDIAALILAGGRSCRMGRPKPFLEVEGETLLERAVRTVRKLDPVEVLISGRAGHDYAAVSGCRVLLDREPDLGPLGGIERGLAQNCAPLLLVLAVDLPHMTAGFLCRLLEHCDAATGVVPRRQGQLEPLAAVYPTTTHRLADRLLAERQLAAQAFASTCVFAQAVRLLEVRGDEARLLENWNTPADAAAGTLVPSHP